ncbi:hypothetical protein D3C76_767030 [compost metagenome]
MSDQSQVRLDMQQRFQLIVIVDHVLGRDERVVSNFLGRRQDDELSRKTPVADQCRQHDPCSDRRFTVFLRDAEHHFPNQTLAGLAVVAAEDGPGERQDPGCAGGLNGGAARGIDDLQPLEHIEAGFSFVWKQRLRDD